MLRIVNRQRIPIFFTRVKEHVTAMRAALGCEACGVGVLLVSDGEMAFLNKKYRGVDSATDVLSFPAAQEGGMMEGSREAAGGIGDGRREREQSKEEHDQRVELDLGDIVLAPAYIRRTARADGTSLGARLPVGIGEEDGWQREREGEEEERGDKD